MDDAYARMQRRLRRLHDALEQTPIAGRYWMSGGGLIGWAREGRLLGHDARDVDFHYRAEDSDRLESTLPLLAQAGFSVGRRFPNIDPSIPATEWALMQDEANFDFFRIDLVDGHWRSHSYGWLEGAPTQNELSLPAQPLEEFEFLGRYWLKAADHDAELTALYGDWRTPDPHHDYMRNCAIVARNPWAVGPGFEVR